MTTLAPLPTARWEKWIERILMLTKNLSRVKISNQKIDSQKIEIGED